MALDLEGAVLCTETVLWFLLEETLEQVSQFMGNVGWYVGVAKLDFIEEFRSILRVKRGQSYHHFVDERTQTPPIHRFPMPLFVKDLRGQILWCPANGVSVIVGDIHFGESEVSKAEVSVLIDENILRFQTE